MPTFACLVELSLSVLHTSISCGPSENEENFHLELSQIPHYEGKLYSLWQPSWKKRSESSNPSQRDDKKSNLKGIIEGLKKKKRKKKKEW